MKRGAAALDSGESTSADGSGTGSHTSTPNALVTDTTGNGSVLKRNVNTIAASSRDTTTGRPSAKKPRLSDAERENRIAEAMRVILETLDDDPDREGLRKTPMRYAKAVLNLTSGYRQSVAGVLGDAEFDENHSEMVLIRSIDTFSHCEHHLLPFYGSCHVAYIPSGPVIGLSKIARIVDMYSRRLQVQERLTSQIADAVMEATNARGVMVYVSCTHMCMVMRGVRKVGASTTTTAARGCYTEDANLRREFLSLVSPPSSPR